MAARHSKGFKFTALCTASVLAFSIAQAAHAQTADSQVQTHSKTVSFDIPAKPLAEALTDYSKQSDVFVFAPGHITKGKTSKPVKGEMTPEIALDKLIGDDSLNIRRRADGSVTIAQYTPAVGSESSRNFIRTAAAQEQTGSDAAGPDADKASGGVVVSGRVTDVTTGANLKGALVILEPTGQTTSTNDLGRYRFPSVQPGSYTIRVSYLGYEGGQENIRIRSGQSTMQDFALGGDVAVLDTIVVYGQRSARAQALNQERAAENASTVLSSDLLGNFTGTTISESLRRASGVAFEQDPNTGDGTNIIIRGLAPDLNTVTFNGIELPESSGQGRSADLGGILADSIESVTINTSLLPSQDSAGIGGLVEIETKSALDRPERFAQFAVDYRERENDFAEDLILSGILSGTFGTNNNLGASVSVQYRDRSSQSVSGGNNSLLFGGYLPLDGAGNPTINSPVLVPPGNAFPFFDTPGADSVYARGLDESLSQNDTETLSVGLNLAWDVADHTSLRFDYQRIEDTLDSFRSTYLFDAGGGYGLRPVVARGGEELRALGNSSFSATTSHTASSVDGGKDETDIYSFRGETSLSQFDFNYDAAFTSGKSSRRDTSIRASSFSTGLNIDQLPDSLIDPVEGIILSAFPRLNPEDENITLPGFSIGDLALANSGDVTTLGFGTIGTPQGENERFAAGLSARYNADWGNLTYVEVGIDYEDSSFSSIRSQANVSAAVRGTTLSELGVVLDRPVLSEIGLDTGLLTLSNASVEDFLARVPALQDQGLVNVTELLFEDNDVLVSSNETEIAPYIQIRFDIGNLEIIGGGRYTMYEVEASDLDQPSFRDETGFRDPQFTIDNSVFRTESATQEEFLPRVLMNYRFNDEFVLRAGYFKSIARPQLSQISRSRQFVADLRPRFGPNRDLPILRIREGNENLEPASTDNFDISLEYYDGDIGAFKIAGFYKEIENLTELNRVNGIDSLEDLTLPPFPTDFDFVAEFEADRLFVDRTQPENNPEKATIWGFTASAEKQFTMLPDWWSGFGIFANYTYTESEKDQPINVFNTATRVTDQFVVEGVDFYSQPNHSGTVALTYNKYGIDSSLIYSAQSRRQTAFVQNGLSQFSEGVDTLDFRFTYLLDRAGLPGDYILSFEATDILRGSEDPLLISSQGNDTAYYTSRGYFGGRELRLGITATF